MPQLDFFSISNQFFWGSAYFFIFYFIVELFLVPSIFSSLFAREQFVKNNGVSLFDTFYYSFFSFYLFSTFVQDFIAEFETSTNDLSILVNTSQYLFEEVVYLELEEFDYEIDLFENDLEN